MRKIKNILVTGGAGFIGSAFIRYLLEKEDFSGKIVNYDLLTYAGNLKNLSSIEKDPRYFFVQADICNYSFLDKICQMHEIDTIVHFAAETHVDNSILSPEKFLMTNVFGTFYLLEVVKTRAHIHFHHVSTDEVYGQLKKRGYFNEKSKYCPSSPYSASKAASDHLVNAYGRTYGISFTLSHCSNNYGPFQHQEKLIPKVITRALDGKNIPVYGEGKNIRDWLYVDDHADALWTILTKGKKGETYDIGGKEEKLNIEVVKEILSLLSLKMNKPLSELLSLIENVKDRVGHDFRYAIDSKKIEKELKWQPKNNFNKGLEKTVDWYIKNKFLFKK